LRGQALNLWVSPVPGRRDREEAIELAIKALMDGPKKLGELMEITGLPKKRLQRALKEMMSKGLVVQDRERGPYRLTRIADFKDRLPVVHPYLPLALAASTIESLHNTVRKVRPPEANALASYHALKASLGLLCSSILMALVLTVEEPSFTPEALRERYSIARWVSEGVRTLWRFIRERSPGVCTGLILLLLNVGSVMEELGFKDWPEVAEALQSYVMEILVKDPEDREAVKALLAYLRDVGV